LSARPRSASARLCSEERGQITVLVALFMALVLIVGACAVDVGLVYLWFARFRNATDAAALAGANERQLNAASGTVGAEAVVRDILARHGYVDDARTDFTVTFVMTADGETVRIDAVRRHATFFLRYFGMPETSFGFTTRAGIGGTPLDVVLSVDTTNSMVDVQNELPIAVKAFVDQLNPSTATPNGPKVALIAYAGIIGGTQRDGQVATFLTQDKALLDRLADNTGSGTCPSAWPSPQPSFATTSGAPVPSARLCPVHPNGGSGTYIGNGFELANRPAQSWSVFSAANGGRPGVKKALVNITDGKNNVPTEAAGDTLTGVAAADVKRGADDVSGTSDDVEIYTIGLFGGSESNFDTNPPLCPAVTVPAGPTTVDTTLIDSSSSTPGSCDHYFPLAKAQVSQLPQIFRTIANQVLRSRLSQ